MQTTIRPVDDAAWIESIVAWATANEENVVLETKRVSNKMVGKALETMCAFANTMGGWLVLGVEDFEKAKGLDRLVGISENAEAVDELARKVVSCIVPQLDNIKFYSFRHMLKDGSQGGFVAVRVHQSEKVHSIVDGGTWQRGIRSNRVMTADEITELSYRRGVRSAESEPVDVDFELLDTDTWKTYVRERDLSATGIADQLHRIGLAKRVDSQIRPLRAAVLLFADSPGALLAAGGSRADVRIFNYKGTKIVPGINPNLRKPPKSISGPLYRLIQKAHSYVLEELAQGLVIEASGFKTQHKYPERVVKEAITNALIHRDYRINRDINIHIFDNRIEVISPGSFPGKITASTIGKAGSFARNNLIAMNLREFPRPPNVDAGEGVPMMFEVMRTSNLYPPQYRETRGQAQDTIVVTLLNEDRPPIWEQVSDWIDREGPLGNKDLCQIADIDTLKASKMLKIWVDQGLLVSDASGGKRNFSYTKPVGRKEIEAPSLLSDLPDNKVWLPHNLMNSIDKS